MDFIERILGISPDAGSGASEWMLLIVPLLVLALCAMHRRLHRAKHEGSPSSTV